VIYNDDMTLADLQTFFGWCSVINIGILLLWFLFFVLAHNFMYWAHSKLFRFSVERFDELHYMLIAQFKFLIIVFNLVPYVALSLMR